MKADEMALECANQIKEYCKAIPYCDGCIFNNDHRFENKCLLSNKLPEDWKIKDNAKNVGKEGK